MLEALRRQVLEIPFRLEGHAQPVAELLTKYADAPMSLADACLVRMSELYEETCVWTLDRHFRTYRRHGRQVIPVLMPPTR